jgi:cell division septation protein DedD
MAGSLKRGGDRVLESRHLVSLFLGVVLLCGVFFTLGYVMGHNQYGGPVHAAESLDSDQPSHPLPKSKAETSAQSAPASAPAPAGNEWDFYSKKSADDAVASRPKPNATPSASAPSVAMRPSPSAAPVANQPAAKTLPAAARFQAPKLNKGAVVLQVAAVTRQGDAMAMADVLQQKHFPSFVVTPTTDNFYRVQVGPYPDVPSAEAAKQALDHAGFIAIIKR